MQGLISFFLLAASVMPSSSTVAPYNLPGPRRITASNLPLPAHLGCGANSTEPGVEIAVDQLTAVPLFNGTLMKAAVATSKKLPTSNDGHAPIPIDEVPGLGVVLPGGLNVYYLDVAPHSEGTMHRTTSTDHLVILSGTLSLLTPGAEPYSVKGGKLSVEPVETLCRPGDVVAQRGMMHALSNRGDEWVRMLAVVLSSEPNKVPIEGGQGQKQLDDAWLA